MSPSAERLKVHRRSLVLDGLHYTALSPRPGAGPRFATNNYHDTWHILSDVVGAQLLARLCWAMAYQRHERTFVVIDPPSLCPNPFDADPSSPVVIVNSDLGPFGRDAADALRAALPFTTPSDGTVVLQTRGLDVALADPKAFAERDDQAGWRDAHQKRRWIDVVHGLLVVAAPPPVLREWGLELSGLGEWSHDGSSWSHLDLPERTGEVQILEEFTTLVDQTVAAREEHFPGRTTQRLSDTERSELWSLRQSPPG